jgi:subtilisin family serine protease
MSLGFRGWWEDFIPIIQIIRANGILPIIAVGNEGPGTSRSPGNYPEALSGGRSTTCPRSRRSHRVRRSRGPAIRSCPISSRQESTSSPRLGNAYQSMSGTSMATPHIAGLAALLWEAKPEATAAEIERAIYDSCQLAGALTPERASRGEPDAAKAFERLTGIALAPATPSVAVPGTPKPRRTKRPAAKKKARSTKASKAAKAATPAKAGRKRIGKKKAFRLSWLASLSR